MSISDLRRCVFVNVFEDRPINEYQIFKLFKQHSQNLNKNGDISFSSNFEVWQHNIRPKATKIHNEKFKLNCENLTIMSEKWPLPIERINIKNERYILFLNRQVTYIHVLSDVLENDSYGKIELNHNFCINIPNSHEDLSIWRNIVIGSTIRNVVKFCTEDESINLNQKSLNIHFLSNESKHCIPNDKIKIGCGIVIDALTRKKTNLKYEEYFGLRRTDMQLMAMHKYGIRTRDNKYFTEFLDKLGKACVIIDLLEVKHASPVQLVEKSHGSSKGASFILYNCARLETLLKTFSDRVEKQFYADLPKFSEIDVKNLSEEEEWQLVFNYILAFPDMVANVLRNLETGQCASHLIPQFLSGLASQFSIYYRRVKILVDNRSHLLDVLFARIYLLKCLQKIFKTCLKFLDIEPIQKM